MYWLDELHDLIESRMAGSGEWAFDRTANWLANLQLELNKV
jgi:hypothetical protein